MENFVLHKAETRGFANHGWLKSYHTFSFANYYQADRIHFGVLRVLNDDKINAGKGFGTHPHDNMEIITIPLEGAIEHKDSLGNTSVIRQGDIQVMSAGTGIQHSEYNKLPDASLKLLQIWVFPNQKNVSPRYDQISLNPADRFNKLQQILSPNPADEGVWIHQNAWFYLGVFEENFELNYDTNLSANGIYVFIIKGSFEIENQILNVRDGLGIKNLKSIQIKSLLPDSEILLMEIPMVN